jgi:hypothetical protein
MPQFYYGLNKTEFLVRFRNNVFHDRINGCADRTLRFGETAT